MRVRPRRVDGVVLKRHYFLGVFGFFATTKLLLQRLTHASENDDHVGKEVHCEDEDGKYAHSLLQLSEGNRS